MRPEYDDGSYSERNPAWHEEDSEWKSQQIRSLLDRNQITGGHICDVGCGVGIVISELAKTYPDTRFTGFDVSPEAIERAQRNALEMLEFRTGNPFASNETYDIAMAIDVVEHVEDCFGFLREMSTLAPMCIFHIPLDLSVFSVARVSPILGAREQVGHLHYFVKETAIAALEETGHEIIDWSYTRGALELPNRQPMTKLLNLIRRPLCMFSEGLTARLLGGFSVLVLTRSGSR